MNLINLFKSLGKKKANNTCVAHYIKCHVFKGSFDAKFFFPLNNCSFDFSVNLDSPSATVRTDFSVPMRGYTHPPTENKKCFAGLDGMWIHELLNFGALKWFGRERERSWRQQQCCKETCQEDVIAPNYLFCWPFFVDRDFGKCHKFQRNMMLQIRTETWVLFQTLEPPNSINSNWQLDIVIKP